MQASVFTFSYTDFTTFFPAFANAAQYPVATLQNYWNLAIDYISANNYGQLNGDARYRAINLLTAHITALNDLIMKGQVPGLVQGATIDKISTTLTPPPLKNQFQWWLSLTPYGQMLLALLQVNSVGGDYVGGSPQRASFRGIGCMPGWWGNGC